MKECGGVYGNVEIFAEDPSMHEMRNVLYIPEIGIFDVGRRPISSGFYFRGPDYNAISTIAPLRYADIKLIVPGEFLYVGYLHPHFGHFILSTLSRLWPCIRDNNLKKRKIVCQSSLPLGQFFAARPWACEMLAALEIDPSSFVTFDQPTVIRSLTVPAPSFEESNHAHSTFAELCHEIGHRVLAGASLSVNARPAYLSKERLVTGVRKLANESEATAILRSRGIEIIYPETMSFKEQVAFWHNRVSVASFVSSALHGSIFAPGRRIVAHSDTDFVNSSFVLLDGINGAEARYLAMPDGGIVGRAATAEFGEVAYLAEPHTYANSIMEALQC